MRLIDLTPLHEIDFSSQGAFDRYNKQHKLRPDTKVSVAGRVTTAGRASQNSAPVKGTSIFNKDAEKNAQSSLANDKESPFKVTYVDDKGNTQIANTFKSKDDADNYASHFSPSSQVKVVSADDDKLKKYGDNAFNQMMGNLDKKEPKRVSLSDELDNIKDLTDKNDHNGAVMALAKMTGDKSYIEQMQKIQKYHKLKGHMPQSLIKYRTAIMKNLLAQVQKKYGDKFAKQVNNAF
jgi:hypothetical protein